MATARQPRIYIYKMTVDNGGAPCVHKGIMSLCICKPGIRNTAEKGDIVIGFGGKSVRDLKERLIYIMEVSDYSGIKEYYRINGNWWNRPDCIYKFNKNENKYVYREDRKYDGSGPERDLGQSSSYEKTRCLIGTKFRYFGGQKKISISDLEPKYAKTIRKIYAPLRSGHRVSYKKDTYEILDSFVKFIFKKYEKKYYGKPTQPPEYDGNCNPCKPPRHSCK